MTHKCVTGICSDRIADSLSTYSEDAIYSDQGMPMLFIDQSTLNDYINEFLSFWNILFAFV